MTKRFSFSFVAIGFIAFGAAPALAQSPAATDTSSDDPKTVCAQSFEQAQRLRNQTKYLAAKDQSLRCADPRCGDALFQECSKIYEELEAAIPSVVFGARDAAKGIELTDVIVTIDGQQATTQLDGKPIRVDPGGHVFTFTAPNLPTVERQLVVRAGEQFRQISVVLGEGAADAPTAPIAPTPSTPPAALEPRSRKVPAISYVLGGVSVLALGGFVALRVVGSSDYDKLKDTCAPDCSDSDVSSVRGKYVLSYASLGLSAAALIGAVTIYLVQPSESSAPQTAAFVSPTADGFAGGFRTTF